MKIGLLGGGQLGRMFLQAAANYPFIIKVLDPQADAPCAHLCDEFVQGDFRDEETVVAFGTDCDVIGIEIEHVSVAGLRRLQAMGKKVLPDPEILAIIQDKGVQKQFYERHHLPTAPFYLIERKTDIDLNRIPLPFVQKTRTGGYDGKGVQIIRRQEDLAQLWDVSSVIEALCPIAQEIAVIVLRDEKGSTKAYPAVEMVFDPQLNLVDVVRMPAMIAPHLLKEAERLALTLADAFAHSGIYAVEMFVTKHGAVWLNETACRVHNSGHLTIEACYHSQFDQLWRLLAGQPLASVAQHTPAAMINIVGAEHHCGRAKMAHLHELLALEHVFVHWYGKTQTRAGRKMGHVTIVAKDSAAVDEKVVAVKKFVDVIAEKE